jgi:hypothetical protein
MVVCGWGWWMLDDGWRARDVLDGSWIERAGMSAWAELGGWTGKNGVGWWKDLGGVMGAENEYLCPQMDEGGCVEVEAGVPGERQAEGL